MNVRKQSGLPTTPPHIGDDELFIDEATGKLHYLDSAGAVQPAGGRRFVGLLEVVFSTDTPTWIRVLRNDFGSANPVVTIDADYEGEGYKAAIVTLPDAASAPQNELFAVTQPTVAVAVDEPLVLAIPYGAGVVAIIAIKPGSTETGSITLFISIEHVAG